MAMVVIMVVPVIMVMIRMVAIVRIGFFSKPGFDICFAIA